jgi:exopolyphosphatase/guanosine-5'-triphosphate,3'-diphosphate pyrophosphatase
MYAVIDIGSNTIRLSVFKANPTGLELVFTKKESAGLAQFVDKNNNMNDEGIQKAIATLKQFDMILKNVTFKDVYVFATAAIRNAKNSLYIVDCIEKETGFDIVVLSDSQEATFAYYGASQSLDIDEGLLIDLGGGSTEVVIYKGGNIRYEVSIPLGSLNIYNKHVKKLFPTKKEIKAIKKDYLKELKKIDYKKMDCKIDKVCGVGGSCRSSLKIVNRKYKLPVFNNVYDIKAIHKVIEESLDNRNNTLHDLLKVVPDRIHTILPGLVAIVTICEYFDCSMMLISQHGVREGYLWNKVSEQTKEV